MSANADLLDILKDALNRHGAVTGRRMFGGIGVYFDGTFFALIDGGVVYVRTSEATRMNFKAEGSQAFTYATRKGQIELGSYWSLPERLLDDPDELRDWAKASIAAAVEVNAAKAKKRTPGAPRRQSTASPRSRKP